MCAPEGTGYTRMVLNIIFYSRVVLYTCAPEGIGYSRMVLNMQGGIVHVCGGACLGLIGVASSCQQHSPHL